MSKEKEYQLDQGLKAFEAELASLVPRTDRLDRERLIFLAGQQSIAAKEIRPATLARRWAWPAAFAAMTTVAATLAIMLLIEPRPQVVVRYVEVPIETPPSEAIPSESIEPRPTNEPSSPSPQQIERPPLPRPTGGGLWASLESPKFFDGSRDRPNGTRAHPRLVQQILAEGLDCWKPPRGTPSQNTRSAPAPAPYRELLKRFLNDQARAEASSSGPASNTSFHSGVNS